MARIFFIRHGQASFLKSDYDQLSERGIRQATLLGKFWNHAGIRVDRIFSGQLRRQQQTAEAFIQGLRWTGTICCDPGFDEHHGPEIVKPYFPEEFVLDREIPESEFDVLRRRFYGTYFNLAIPWVNGELEPEKIGHIEPWHAFRTRFRNAFRDLLDTMEGGSNVLVFTSGGPVGASVGEALDLDDQKTLQLGWQVKNTSVTELLYGKKRLSLVSFNEIPHLSQSDLITLV